MTTIYQCDKCKQMFSNPCEAQECESSHHEINMTALAEYKHKVNEPYPRDIILPMTDGGLVMYTYRALVQGGQR